MSTVALLALAWALAALLQLSLFLTSLRTRNAGIVDVGWAVAFAAVALAFCSFSSHPLRLTAPITAMVVLWSLRLAIYLFARGAAAPNREEGRYAELRRKWSPHANRSFFIFFQAQAALVAVLALGFVFAFGSSPVHGDWLLVLGGAIWLVGLTGESIADLQLARWKRTAARGAVCARGLWSWSRHPNYFFETLVWVGYATYSSAFAGGYLAWIAPALIFASIWKVTGIPATEAQALRSRGDAYRAYQRRTSVFVPWPPLSGDETP